MVEFQIGQMEAGKKVHRLVRQLLPGIPLSGIYKMLRVGRVKKNGRRVKPDDRVEAGDVLQIYIADEDYERVRRAEKKFAGVPTEIDVVYEDADMLVVNKPAGLLTHGAAGEYKDTLVNRVLAYLHAQGQLDQRIFTPAPVNRLDRNTSGLVVFGRTAASTRRLAADFAAHRVRKWYLAIVQGQPPQEGEMVTRLRRVTGANQTRVAASGKPAVTRYRVEASTGRTSVVRVELVSGRTHQIRAHFQHHGFPLWGDVKYGGAFDRTAGSPSHQWLHAAWLEFSDGRRLFAPLPEGFVAALRRLGYSAETIDRLQQF